MRKKFSARLERSIAKSVVFRIITIVTDLVVIYLLTHRFDVALGVTILTNISSTFLYFIHERIWNKISWGKASSIETMET